MILNIDLDINIQENYQESLGNLKDFQITKKARHGKCF